MRLALFFEVMFPAAENSRSDGVEVAGMHKNDLANDERLGYFASFDFHQDRGFSVLDSGCSPKYVSTYNGKSQKMKIRLVNKNGMLQLMMLIH